MLRRGLTIAGLVLLAVLLTNFSVAQAGSFAGTINITCTGFNSSDIVTLDRDNTGAGNELYRYEVTDGAGTLIFTFQSQLPLGGYTMGGAAYTTAPQYNPITVTMISLAGNGLPQQTITQQSGTCSGLPTAGVYLAAPVPSGFVLRTITCDVAVYSSAGGTPVGDNKVTAGQTWFVSTTPVQAADGQSWTEIFVAGLIDGFVPTSCVQ